VEIRAATANDYDDYARLVLELRIDDPIPSRERFAAQLAQRAIMAVDGAGAVVGYAVFEQLADTGYVRNIASDPSRRRQGIGAALMANLRARFVASGATMWCLNVKPDNEPAIALYIRCGLAPAFRSAALRFAADIALAVRADLAIAPLDAAEDASVEPRFQLLRGQLAGQRARANHVLALRRGADIVGVACFNTSVPGAFPFRCAAPEYGPPFAALLRPLASPTAPWLQVGTENDDALRAALEAAGALCHLEILHMRGALPAGG
jgi:ribosomal protein S18 acetylase RimI-like enzyme